MNLKLYNFKKNLYFIKFYVLFKKALKEGKITKFDDEIFKRMEGIIITCLPVSLFIKYSNHLFASGTCYDRSLYMLLALDNALYVTGDNKDLEYNYGKGNENHAWIEIGDYVYDPSLMLKFDKNTYYSLYKCSNVNKMDKQTYLLKHKDFVEKNVHSSYDEFKPKGKKRLELGIFIGQILSLAKSLNDKQFIQDLENYLTLVEYDENQIFEEQQEVIQSILSDTSAMAVISGNRK